MQENEMEGGRDQSDLVVNHSNPCAVFIQFFLVT